jgi:hypothetical protein
MATHKPDGDGAPWTQLRITIMIMIMMAVLMVMAIIIVLGVDDAFVNCDRRFGRWWTRRFLPVCQCVGSDAD